MATKTVTLSLVDFISAPGTRAQARLILENDLEPYMSEPDTRILLLMDDAPPYMGSFAEELFGGAVRRWGPDVKDRLVPVAAKKLTLRSQALRFMDQAVERYERIKRAEANGWKFGSIGDFLGMDGEEEAYIEALAEVDQLMTDNPPKGTVEGDRLEFLAELIEAYEDEHYPIERPSRKASQRFHWDRTHPKLAVFRYNVEDFMKNPFDRIIYALAWIGAAPHFFLGMLSPKFTDDLRISMAVTLTVVAVLGLWVGALI